MAHYEIYDSSFALLETIFISWQYCIWLKIRPILLSVIKWNRAFVIVHNGRDVLDEIDDDTSSSIPVYGSGGIFKFTTYSLYSEESVLFGRKGTLGRPIYVNGAF